MASQTFAPSIDKSIPQDVQRHLQLIYNTLNNHALSFQSLPKAEKPQPVTTKTFFPSIERTIPHAVQQHLELIYGKINNHATAFTQLPKVTSTDAEKQAAKAAPPTFAPQIEETVPYDVQRHLQLIYAKLDNHTRAFDFYKAHLPAAQK